MATERLSRNEAATRLGLTPQQVGRLVADGMPSATKGSGYVVLWPEARRWRDNQLREEGARKAKPSTMDEARLRRETADAELKELELAARRGELIPLTDYDQSVAATFARVRSKLLNLPNAVAMRVTGDTLAARTAQAQSLVDEIMGELSGAADVPELEEGV